MEQRLDQDGAKDGNKEAMRANDCLYTSRP